MKLKAKTYTLKEAFGDEYPDGIPIEGFEQVGHPNQLEREPHWIWDKSVLLDLVIWWSNGGFDPAYSFGPTGCGKSTSFRNFAASLGVPVYQETVHRRKQFFEMVMSTDLVDGNTLNQFGSLPLAMGADGAPGILLLDEFDRGDDDLQVGLYEVLEGRPVAVNNGGLDSIKPQQGFRVVATGNTSMLGDHVGLHRGAETCDVAAMDRFRWKFKFDYPAEEVELAILGRVAPDVPEQVRTLLVQAARDIRAMSMYESSAGDALPFTLSTRGLISWAEKVWHYRALSGRGLNPVRKALDVTLLNATSDVPEWRDAILKVVKGRFGDDIAPELV